LATRGARWPRVVLRKKLARALHQGHPWVYRDALAATGAAGASELRDGTVVTVAGPDERPIGVGFWSASSPIAVRMLATGPRARALTHPGDVRALVDERLGAALARRLRSLDLEQTNAFRWVHGEADGLPGVHVDVYGHVATVRYDGTGAAAFHADLPARLVAAAGEHLRLDTVLARRPGGRASSGAASEDERGEPANAVVLGAAPDGEVEVRENGLRFGVDVLRGQKGGLFLDQRENRARVRALAAGRRVLNLFGYTGGFSVHAAAGGATATTTVDVAPGAIATARANFARNGLGSEAAELVVADAFAFLDEAFRRGRRWDLVICDPPSFAPSRQALPQAMAAYRRLHAKAAAVLDERGGILCAASCSSHVLEAAFVETIRRGLEDARRIGDVRERWGAGADHPVSPAFPEGGYLKFVVVGVAARQMPSGL
jgi:23S rRNA (cytosine1962-C5)-methyltransferase